MSTSEIRLWPVPRGAVFTSCRGCGERIAWGKTDRGRNVPLSIDSKEAEWRGEGAQAECIQAPSHFTDCSAANQFSGRDRK